MDILFINSTSELSLRKECNGTLLLGTKLLDDGFTVGLLRFGELESYGGDYEVFIADITEKILRRNPRCVSLYCLWPNFHIMLRIGREIKVRNPGIILVLGGPQTSGTARQTMEAMPFVDYISTGEGENLVVPLFRSLLRAEGEISQVPGVYYRKDGEILCNQEVPPLCDLETLPRWDDRLLLPQTDPDLQEDYYFMPIDAGRGCPYSCTFCCTSYFWRRTYRLKSPERIISDIRYYYETYGIHSFWFSHDAFTVNQNLVSQVCDRILEEGLKITWRCTARLDCISEALILKMKQAGMIQIELGVETGSQRMQKCINKNLNLKKAEGMVRFLLDQGIRVALFFMYGFPEETEEDLNQTLELVMKLLDMGVAYTTMSFCQFSPNTQLTDTYFDQLIYDPDIQITHHGTYGYREEEPVIRENKALFPFYFHLNTPLRNEYQYLHFLIRLYRSFPNTVSHVRKLYQGDNLRFFRDLYDYNRHLLEGDIEIAEKNIDTKPLEMLLNITAHWDLPYIRQLEGLLKYSYCVYQVSRSTEDVSVTDTYDFNYVDLKLQHPLEQYAKGKTQMLVEKTGGKFQTQVLNISWE